MPSPPRVRHLGCTKAFLRNLFFGPSQGSQFPALHLKRNILQRVDPVRRRRRGVESRESRVESRGRWKRKSRDQSRASSGPPKRGNHSQSEWKQVFRSPSASLLASGLPKTPPNQISDSGPQLPPCSLCPLWLTFSWRWTLDTDFVRSFTSPIFRYESSFPRTLCHQRFTSCASDPVPTSPRR